MCVGIHQPRFSLLRQCASTLLLGNYKPQMEATSQKNTSSRHVKLIKQESCLARYNHIDEAERDTLLAEVTNNHTLTKKKDSKDFTAHLLA